MEPLAQQDAVTPHAHYQSRKAQARAEVAELDRTLTRLSRFRIAAFAAATLPLLLLEGASVALRPALAGFAVAMTVVFVALVRRFLRTERLARNARLRETLAGEALARLDRRWDDLPPAPLLAAPPDHPCADDLDLVGRASLSQLIGRVTTAAGRAVLRRILLDPFARPPDHAADLLLRESPEPPTPTPEPNWLQVVRDRQEAVRILARDRALREDIECAAREASGGGRDADTARFLEWLAQPRWLDGHRRYVHAARVLAVVTPASLTAWWLWQTPGMLPVLGGLAAYALQWAVGRQAAARFAAAEAGDGDLEAWSAQLAIAARLPEGSALLDRLRQASREPAPGAGHALEELAKIAHAAGVRHSALSHFPLVVLFAWDVHLLDRLERWHANYGAAVAHWIQTMGELEALAALGGLLHDHPAWTFPDFIEGSDGIRARALGHPLVEPARCVRNDVALPAPGRLLLVTGSNMAGKTTLLRAVGVNQVLALAGAPVAAERLTTRALVPWCMMRVRDSLDRGVSYFLAELRRLKLVVDAAEAGPVLYLLDEMLQGTNSAERRTAARIVLARLLETPAIGAVTTHDLGLAETPELRDHTVDVHFREEVAEIDGKRTLEFDYVLRPGPATSRNALLLLEMSGLGPPRPAP